MGGATLVVAVAGTTGGAGAGVFDFSEGAGFVTIPTGFTSLTIEVWGGGGGGGWGTISYTGFPEFEEINQPGGGGGSGAYAKTIVAIGGGDVGKTIAYGVGVKGTGGVAGNPTGYSGGISSASAGTFTIDEMVCTGGFGGYGGLGTLNGRQGAGGVASGGNTTNTNGNGGALYDQMGAAAVAGVNSLTGGAGGNGGDATVNAGAGNDGSTGRVRFAFS
jgi:hypothetical protein